MGGASYDNLEFEDDLTTNIGPRSREKQAGTSDRGQNERNKGKGKLSYEDNITAMATTYIAKQERYVSSRESRQTGSTSDEIFKQVVEIITAMSEFTCK